MSDAKDQTEADTDERIKELIDLINLHLPCINANLGGLVQTLLSKSTTLSDSSKEDLIEKLAAIQERQSIEATVRLVAESQINVLSNLRKMEEKLNDLYMLTASSTTLARYRFKKLGKRIKKLLTP